MNFIKENDVEKVTGVKIAYIGGGSRAWARVLMNDLAKEDRLNGEIRLYDLNYDASEENCVIGNRLFEREDIKSSWKFINTKSLQEAITGVDFVVISILPGTLDEMEIDVELPKKYGIYQSVGDTVGPGGAIRALRTVPMFAEIAKAVKEYCPEAWVINYTNPMTICTQTLYEVFPEIKAFGCCHEVFATQQLFANIYNGYNGTNIKRQDVRINVVGINHFTFVNRAYYKNTDLMPLYKRFISENEAGLIEKSDHWMNSTFGTKHLVQFDLYKRYGIAGAAGDRHLAEFCPGEWYLKDPDTVKEWGFELTLVSDRKKTSASRSEETKDVLLGKKDFEIRDTGEEGVQQMCALLGISPMITNVNIPNKGQIENLPLGAVVETNATFDGNNICPVFAGEVPEELATIMRRHISNQKLLIKAGLTGDYELAYRAMINDPNLNLPLNESKKMFLEMIEKTQKYLPFYDAYIKSINK